MDMDVAKSFKREDSLPKHHHRAHTSLFKESPPPDYSLEFVFPEPLVQEHLHDDKSRLSQPFQDSKTLGKCRSLHDELRLQESQASLLLMSPT